MSTSRAPSQAPSPYSRKRSSTLQSTLRSPISATPLTVGNSKDLTLWVQDQVSDVVFNPECWPGVAEGDMIRVTELVEGEVGEEVNGVPWERHGFLFIVKLNGEESMRHSAALQVSVTLVKMFICMLTSKNRYLCQAQLPMHLIYETIPQSGSRRFILLLAITKAIF